RLVAVRVLQAVRCADPFHVIKWATEALDELRCQVWNDVRRAVGGSGGRTILGGRVIPLARGDAQQLKKARWALWKNPENLTGHQQARLAWIAKTDPRLYRG